MKAINQKSSRLRFLSSNIMFLAILLSTISLASALCEDSDGGQNAFINGYAQWNQYAGDPNIIFRNDYCTKQESPIEVTNYCNDTDCGVIEFYCGNNGDSTYDLGIMQLYIPCDYGCMDGACLTSITPPDEPSDECFDTDGGDNKDIRGVTKVLDDINTDYCVDDNEILEYYCYEESIANRIEICPDRCLDGSCQVSSDVNDTYENETDDDPIDDSYGKILNIDFGPYIKSPTKKTGPAAVGKCNDFWNTVFAGGGLESYDAQDMPYADRTRSSIDGTFVNLAGSWAIISSAWDYRAQGINPDTLDVMFNDYNYPYYNHGGESWVYLKNIPAGEYDVYIYGMADTYELSSGNREYGKKEIASNPRFFTEKNWIEGHQYVKYSDVNINSDGKITIHLLLGSNQWKDTNINGLQIVPAGTPLNEGSGTNMNPCKEVGEQCKEDSDCPKIACLCASSGIVGCNCPISVCKDGRCTTEVKQNNNSVRCELASTHEDMASVQGIYGPGPGFSGLVANDYKWSCSLNLDRSTKINGITIEHKRYGEGWTTKSARMFGLDPYPIVVTQDGLQFNHRYDEVIGPFGPGTVRLDLFGQIESIPFMGGKIIIDFDSTEDLIGEIPASSLGLERLDLSQMSCADTDGLDYRQAGSLAFSSSDGVLHVYEDYCINNEKVAEGLCGGPGLKQAVVSHGLCRNGCSDGACQDQVCNQYHYSNCPDSCTRICIPSVCSGDICTADCEGPGSCVLSDESNFTEPILLDGRDMPVEVFGNEDALDEITLEEDYQIDVSSGSFDECDGCTLDGKCLSYGIRISIEKSSKFCDLSGGLEQQKEELSLCDNNYECESNYCGNGKCTDLVARMERQESQLQKILSWLKNIMGFD